MSIKEQDTLLNRITELEKRYKRLEDLEEIKKLKARYFRFVDEKKWPEFADLFTEDADIFPDGYRFKNSQEMASVIDSMVEAVPSVHHGHMPEIEFIDDDNAQGIWAMEDLFTFPANKEGVPEGHNGYGQYRETYRRVNGVWKISSLVLTRFRMDPLEHWDLGKDDK
ncbi:bile-acid 7-alpha-dehydratase [Paenibacillus glycanilyticus]|uniref:Bile-acid 7-alpha-dehydratase n=1 Tax=Paenibacillus glycanilyticus TaxID=126569 RepID=A0ABQ6NRM1_9BACL|nr:nuclear transport factor 2 family protein [Paenibacillus glycanilyticus]GMK47463.1 bile-acid 7-alpha-dehydratase [Paenibacillus glycanilyticus]